MDGEQRRRSILKLLSQSSEPISGSELSRIFSISRQAVVQDIALLRAENKNILSTNKGYVCFQATPENVQCKRVFHVVHTNDQVQDEFYTIVDRGGKIRDVSVEHELYGQIQVDLIINNRLDADDFVRRMAAQKDKPLNVLTGGSHYHTVIADSEKNLELIEEALREKGYLVESN